MFDAATGPVGGGWNTQAIPTGSLVVSQHREAHIGGTGVRLWMPYGSPDIYTSTAAITNPACPKDASHINWFHYTVSVINGKECVVTATDAKGTNYGAMGAAKDITQYMTRSKMAGWSDGPYNYQVQIKNIKVSTW
jgi:hypothetical protein